MPLAVVEPLKPESNVSAPRQADEGNVVVQFFGDGLQRADRSGSRRNSRIQLTPASQYLGKEIADTRPGVGLVALVESGAEECGVHGHETSTVEIPDYEKGPVGAIAAAGNTPRRTSLLDFPAALLYALEKGLSRVAHRSQRFPYFARRRAT